MLRNVQYVNVQQMNPPVRNVANPLPNINHLIIIIDVNLKNYYILVLILFVIA